MHLLRLKKFNAGLSLHVQYAPLWFTGTHTSFMMLLLEHCRFFSAGAQAAAADAFAADAFAADAFAAPRCALWV